jgi:hypothetical protein
MFLNRTIEKPFLSGAYLYHLVLLLLILLLKNSNAKVMPLPELKNVHVKN